MTVIITTLCLETKMNVYFSKRQLKSKPSGFIIYRPVPLSKNSKIINGNISDLHQFHFAQTQENEMPRA